MTDDRAPPPEQRTPLPKRALTLGDRNEAHRVRLPVPRGIGLTRPPINTPELVFEGDITSTHAIGPELDAARAKRPTDQRVALLEKKNDAFVALMLAREAADVARRALYTKVAGAIVTAVSMFFSGMAAGRC